MDRIIPYIDQNIIKILVGQRRVGKSYILKSVAAECRRRNPDANIVTINLEDFSFSHITTTEALYQEIISRLANDRKNYIFLDEVQEVKEFDKVVRSLNLDPKNDIYLTGSNSDMLSSEIASRLAGRSIQFQIHPLTYREFLEFHKLSESDSALSTYLRYGGLPYLMHLPDHNTWSEYLIGIRNSIVGYRPNDIGGLMENVVYNHLAASGYQIKVGVGAQGREIDFIAEKNNEYRYVQVALSVMNDETARREFGNLADIPDNYEKIVVTYVDSAPNTYQGIRQMSLREFLLS